jgi:hypothetical protein
LNCVSVLAKRARTEALSAGAVKAMPSVCDAVSLQRVFDLASCRTSILIVALALVTCTAGDSPK